MAPAARDANLEVAGQLYDLALVHRSSHGRIAYRRAAQAILALEEPLDAWVRQHAPRELRFVGPASERVILECLKEGRSPTVERTVRDSGRAAEVDAARRLRVGFLSRAAARAALAAPARGAIARDDYCGDLQMHTEWSDGAEGIAGMATAAKSRGYRWIGVSDHAYGLKIAGGMSMDEARRQRAEIERLNRDGGGVRVLQGIEANIPLEGGVDMTPEELASFDVVLAAPHSRLRRSEDQTARMLATVRTRGVHVLAHPRGRMFTRAGVQARWDEVFAAAGSHGVAVELDGDPWRQDLDWRLAARALAAGCLFAIDSDAHSGAELRYADIALAHARRAGSPAARVINTWSAERLLAWTRRPRRRRARAH